MTIDEILDQKKVLITCGTGGVGKTTLSAALAIRATLLGKKTVVITIDPAKRLAQSLGLKSLTDQPTDLTQTVRDAYQKIYPDLKKGTLRFADGFSFPAPDKIRGSLSAIVPDTKRTFENFVKELAPNPMVAERVMRNPIFQIFAKEFSGTNEYMALERLLSLHKKGGYDCIILDTPPSRNTLAFLEAPKILSQFFEERLIRWLVVPANKVVSIGMRKALGILEKLTGTGFMTHLFDFAEALFEVQVKFSTNLKKITSLLESPSVGFFMVTTPTPETAKETEHFIQNLKEHRFYFEGLILNRMIGYLKKQDPKQKEYKDEHKEKSENQSTEAHQILTALKNREQKVLKNIVASQIPVCATLPELARDVHSVEDLTYVALAFNRPHSLLYNADGITNN